jgi:putative transposase
MPRYPAPGVPQHVTQRGTNRSILFVADSDYRFFRDCLRTACVKHGCYVHAYALMTNHVHLLVTPTTALGIARMMQSVCRRYVRRFNEKYERTGTLCQGRYKATLVATEQYFFACHRYIELNPVRAGLVADPRHYAWSSHRANALGANDPLVTPHERYVALGGDVRGRRAAYRALFRAELPDSLIADIRHATQAGWPLGSKRSPEEITTLAGAAGRKSGPQHRNDAIGVRLEPDPIPPNWGQTRV